MTATYKRGSTLKVLLEFDVDEWAALYPWDSVTADARQGVTVHDLTTTVTAIDRSVLLTASTTAWALAPAQIDVRIMRSGEVIYTPGASNLMVNIISPVTEA